MSDSFSLLETEILRKDFYEKLYQQSVINEIPSGIMIANGSRVREHFSPWLSDTQSMLRQVMSFNDILTKDFYYYRELYKLYGKQSALTQIINGFMETSHIVHPLDAYHEDVTIGLVKPNIFDLRKEGTSQHYRNLQVQYRSPAMSMLRECIGLIPKLEAKTNCKFYIRPMISLMSNDAQNIYASMIRQGMANIGHLHNKAQFALRKSLEANKLFILPDMYDYTPNEIEYNRVKEYYWKFHSRASYAFVQDNNEEWEVSISPANIPPVFLAREGADLPVNWTIPQPTPMLTEWLYYYSLVPTASPYVPQVKLTAAAQGLVGLLPVVTACVTIISATLPLGSGNHKMKWTNQSLNTEFIRNFVSPCMKAIENARSQAV